MIKLTTTNGKVLINLNTLRYYTCTVYIKPEFEKDWVQINEKDVKAFIAEQKAQIVTNEAPVEITDVKTE